MSKTPTISEIEKQLERLSRRITTTPVSPWDNGAKA